MAVLVDLWLFWWTYGCIGGLMAVLVDLWLFWDRHLGQIGVPGVPSLSGNMSDFPCIKLTKKSWGPKPLVVFFEHSINASQN